MKRNKMNRLYVEMVKCIIENTLLIAYSLYTSTGTEGRRCAIVVEVSENVLVIAAMIKKGIVDKRL